MPILLVLIVLGVLGVLVAQYQYKQRRLRELAATAATLSLQFSRVDDLGTLQLGFGLFAKGDGNGTENVMWGELEHHPVRIVEYWYYDESTDKDGHHRKSYHHFSCAISELPFAGSGLSIGRENLLSRAASHLGMHDIELESEEFNRTFRLHADDKKFAYSICDARMMTWLLDAGPGASFEIAGPYVMAFTGRLRPRELPGLARTLLGFVNHVPAVCTSLYPPTAPGTHL